MKLRPFWASLKVHFPRPIRNHAWAGKLDHELDSDDQEPRKLIEFDKIDNLYRNPNNETVTIPENLESEIPRTIRNLSWAGKLDREFDFDDQ